MASNRNPSRHVWLTALIVSVALAGVIAGVLTRDVLAASGGGSTVQRQTPQPGPTATAATTEPTGTVVPTAPPTVAPELVHFSIKLAVVPNAGHPGDVFTITATVTADSSGQPVVGITCHLRAPTDGEPALFTVWPAPTATNSEGVATWTATVPTDPSGRYAIEVFAQTPAWSYVARAGYSISAA